MKYNFIYNDTELISYLPVESEVKIVSNINGTITSVKSTIQEFISLCEVLAIDYQLLIDDGLIDQGVNTDEDLIVKLRDFNDTKREIHVLSTPINYSLKKAGMRSLLKVEDNLGSVYFVSLYRGIDNSSSIQVDGNTVNEYDFLKQSSKTIGLIETSRQIILRNDELGEYDVY